VKSGWIVNLQYYSTLRLCTHTHTYIYIILALSFPLYRGTWRHLAAKVGTFVGRESIDKLPLTTCLECSAPEPYRSLDWALVPAKLAQRLNTNDDDDI
jgi:hypothetical protein